MKHIKKSMGLLPALILCLSMIACGKTGSSVGKISIEDLSAFSGRWYRKGNQDSDCV